MRWFVPAAGRRKKLFVANMKSTMIENEMLDELAEFLGLREKIAGITARAMNGDIDFAGALNERVGLLKGLADRPSSTKQPSASATWRAAPPWWRTIKSTAAIARWCRAASPISPAMVHKALGFDFHAANGAAA